MELIPPDLKIETGGLTSNAWIVGFQVWSFMKLEIEDSNEVLRHTYLSKRYALPVLPWKFYKSKQNFRSRIEISFGKK